MASEKQIAANRANAKRSTGPKTAAGKQIASRNAFRHGLSQLEPSVSSSAAMASAFAAPLLPDDATEIRHAAVREFAYAQIELARVCVVRAEQWDKIKLNDVLNGDTKQLKRLASLDRYERYALTRRRKASKSLR